VLRAAAELDCAPLETESALDICRMQLEPPEQVLKDFVDVGDLLAIYGKSKMRKSWFALQLSISIATGKPFVGIDIPKPRKVLHVQLEVQKYHFRNRLQRVISSMVGPTDFIGEDGIKDSQGIDRLQVVQGRRLGIDLPKIASTCELFKPEVVVIDPIYLLYQAESEDVSTKDLVANLFTIAEMGSTVIFIHHDIKGSSGDRDLVDRGAGSSVQGRAYDAAFYIDPHADASEENDLQVIQGINRNYPPVKARTVTWDNWVFEIDEETEPSVQTSASKKEADKEKRKRAKPTAGQLAEMIMDLDLIKSPMGRSALEDFIKEKAPDAGRDVIRCTSEKLVDYGYLVRTVGERGKYTYTPRDLEDFLG